MEQLLRVPVFLEPNLRVSGKILRLGNLGAVQKGRVPLKLDHHPVTLVGRLDLAHLARQHRLAVVHQANRVAQLLHLIHAMRRK